MSRVGKPPGHKVRKHIKNNWGYKGLGAQSWHPYGPRGEETHRKPLVLQCFLCPGLAIQGASGRRKHNNNHWFYNGFGVQGWQSQVPRGDGNQSKTIGFIKVWASRVGSRRGHKVGKHIKNDWFYKALGVQGWQPQRPHGEETYQKPLVL